MGIADQVKNLTKKAEDAAAEHADQIQEAVQKAEVAVDRRTGGRYHDKISRAAAKAGAYVDGLKPADPPAATAPTAGAPVATAPPADPPPASAPTGDDSVSGTPEAGTNR